MEITPPFGYQEVVPFLRDQKIYLHEQRGVMPEFANGRNAMPVTVAEMPYASHDYPIVFAPAGDGKSFIPLAIVGIGETENLFLTNNQWLEGTYVPAYLRRYPFCMTQVTVNGVKQEQRIVCVEKSFVRDDGTALFDAEGQPSERWTQILNFLNEYEADLERTREICSILANYKLLEQFSMQGTVNGKDFNLNGMFRVPVARLEFLTSAEVKTLLKKGAMAAIFTHLASLNRFDKLLAIKSQREAVAPIEQGAVEAVPVQA